MASCTHSAAVVFDPAVAGGTSGPTVETFRKADWIDVTQGVLRFGLSRSFLRSLYSTWPDAGFHAFLVRQTWERAKRHPLSPLPMFRW